MWGCDERAEMVDGQKGVMSIECWSCYGADAECEICSGTGKIWFDRCATALYEPWVGEVLRSWREYRDGFLPVAGGMRDQTVQFRYVLGILGAASSHVEKLMRDKNK